MSPEQIDLEVNIGIDDYRSYIAFISRQQAPILFYILFAALCVTFGYFVYGNSKILAVGVLVGLLYARFVIYVVAIALRRLVSVENSYNLGPRTIRLDREGIQERARSMTFVPWSSVWSLQETKTHYFIVLDRPVAFIVPKRCLPDIQVQQSLAEFVRDRATGEPV